MNKMLRSMGLTALTVLCAAAAHAQVTVKDPWVRGTVAGQTATGAFMTLTSATNAKVISVSSPVAGVVQLHEMAMNKGTMQMREVSGGLALPAGKPVELRPGSYHVMLMELKQPIKAGENVPLTFVVEAADKTRSTVEVSAPVKPLGAMPAKMPEGHQHQHEHQHHPD